MKENKSHTAASPFNALAHTAASPFNALVKGITKIVLGFIFLPDLGAKA
jgi:hypothetical protein